MPIRKRQHGFTIVELLVTMAILGLMLFLINEIFNDTSVAVTTSVQNSKTIAASRSINEQFTDDADEMVGPGDPASGDFGYIVIIQQKLPSMTMLDPQTLAEVTVTELRTDQLLFVRDAEGLKSMTPSSASSYGTSIIGQASDRAKVWYGHVQRTDPDGTIPGTSAAYQLGGASSGRDRIGSDFILGRQAMLFNPASLNTGTDAYANTAQYFSTVQGLSGAPGNRSWHGFTDVTAQNYGPVTDTTSLLYQITDTTTLNTAAHTTNYFNTAYPIAANRLRVNTAPDASATNFASWAIAQGHPILAQGCSEIIIDFAADLNGNGQIDRQVGGGTDTTGAIYWYDTLRLPILAIGNYRWDNPTASGQPLINTTLSDQNVFIFRVDDDTPYTTTGTAVSSWPYMIRIRYRLHDTRGRLTSNYADALRDGLDNDGDGAADGSDPLADEDQISGRWFERIISVPRP